MKHNCIKTTLHQIFKPPEYHLKLVRKLRLVYNEEIPMITDSTIRYHTLYVTRLLMNASTEKMDIFPHGFVLCAVNAPCDLE